MFKPFTNKEIETFKELVIRYLYNESYYRIVEILDGKQNRMEEIIAESRSNQQDYKTNDDYIALTQEVNALKNIIQSPVDTINYVFGDSDINNGTECLFYFAEEEKWV